MAPAVDEHGSGADVGEAGAESADVASTVRPSDRVPSYRLVDSAYAFYRDYEPTLLSGTLGWLGLPVYRPPSFSTFLGNPTRNVCGSGTDTPAWVFDRLRLYKAP